MAFLNTSRCNFLSSWDWSLLPCLKPKQCNITWEYMRLNPLPAQKFCVTQTPSDNHMAAFYLAPLQAGLQGCESISASTTAVCWHVGSFLSLSSSAFDIQNSGRLWFILCHNICLCELFHSRVMVVLSLLRKIIPTLNRTEDFQIGDCAKKWPWKSALKCLSRILTRHLAIVISILYSWNLLCKLD